MLLLPPRECWAWLKALWANQRAMRLSRPKLLELQQRKFRALVRHAAAHSPHYRRTMEHLGLSAESCRVEDFPPLSKQQLQANLLDFITDRRITLEALRAFSNAPVDPHGLFLDRYQVMHTSGTSGEQTYIVCAMEDWIAGASVITRVKASIRPRKRIAAVIDDKAHYACAVLINTVARGLHRLMYNVRTINVTQSEQDVIEQLNQFQPYFLTAYSSSMLRLAEAQQRGELRIQPRELSGGGDAISASERAYIERVFGARMHNTYACTEALYLGLTIDDDDCLALQEDQNIIEVFDDHLLVTNLFNFTMPLIRYRINDMLSLAEGLSPRGPLRRVKQLIGRSEAILVFDGEEGGDGVFHWAAMDDLFVPGVQTFQVVQLDRRRFSYRVQYVRGVAADEIPRINQDITQMLREFLDSRRLRHLQFTIDPVPELLPDPRTGKLQRTVPMACQQLRPVNA